VIGGIGPAVLGSTAFFSQFHAKYHAKALGGRAARDRINTILPLTCSFAAEGLGFEPRVTCATMVFETIRFGRSRIPPGEIVRDQEPRLEAKNARSRSPHSSARTPATTSVRWLSRGSAAKL